MVRGTPLLATNRLTCSRSSASPQGFGDLFDGAVGHTHLCHQLTLSRPSAPLQGFGDLFVVRVAGNIVSEHVLGRCVHFEHTNGSALALAH